MWSVVMPVSDFMNKIVKFSDEIVEKVLLQKSDTILLQIGVVAIISANAFMP